MTEEIFGPILPVVKVKDYNEVVIFALCALYRLMGSVMAVLHSFSYYVRILLQCVVMLINLRPWTSCIHLRALLHCTFLGRTEMSSTGIYTLKSFLMRNLQHDNILLTVLL